MLSNCPRRNICWLGIKCDPHSVHGLNKAISSTHPKNNVFCPFSPPPLPPLTPLPLPPLLPPPLPGGRPRPRPRPGLEEPCPFATGSGFRSSWRISLDKSSAKW